jgi:hypothetical protein
MALTTGAKKVVWLRNLFKKFHVINVKKPTFMMCNNQSVIKLSNNLTFHDKIECITIQHFNREKVVEGELEIKQVLLFEHLAKILTKPLGRMKK